MQTQPIRYDETDWKPRPTLTGAEYTSAAIYDEEREKVWWGDWVCLGRTEELPNPGDYIVRDITGESVFIVRNDKDELHGFYNVCSHRGTKFLDDEPAFGNVRKAFVCPYHAWAYDLNGRLIGTPNVKEGELFDRGDYPLHGFPVETYGGFIFVNLAKRPRPFTQYLTEGAESVAMFDRFKLDELRVGVRIVYEVAANWKIVVENYNECLHCPQVHPELVQVVPLFRFGEVWDEETRDDGNWMRDGATSFTVSGESELPKLPDLEPEDYSMYYGAYQFPNLLLNLHPDCVMYYIGYPKGPDHTTVVSEYLFRPETIADPALFKPEPVVELWD
ncbi:MAG TPA: SRPBCC family protein, partial [Actinomycetota bacterium]|nr:SRPBCC family protein [Actinomycetota bacterium]